MPQAGNRFAYLLIENAFELLCQFVTSVNEVPGLINKNGLLRANNQNANAAEVFVVLPLIHPCMPSPIE